MPRTGIPQVGGSTANEPSAFDTHNENHLMDSQTKRATTTDKAGFRSKLLSSEPTRVTSKDNEKSQVVNTEPIDILIKDVVLPKTSYSK